MLFLLALFSITSTLIYFFYQQKFIYWHKRGVPYIEPSIPFGNLEKPWGIPFVKQCMGLYNTFKKRGDKHGGIFLFAKPIYMPIDPELIKNIMIKDFQHFTDRGIYYNEKDQPQIANLFFIEGQRWKMQRQKITSCFTTGKIKMMLGTMLNCTRPLSKTIVKMAENHEAFEARDMMARFTTDVIGSCAFGVDCDSFENPHSDFRRYGDMIFEESGVKGAINNFASAYGDLARKLGILIFPKEPMEFFEKMVIATYDYRKRNDVKRDDFLQLLIEMKDDPNQKMNSLSMHEFVSQAIAFFVGGFDTSSATLSLCLFNLASNLDVQGKLREEVNEVLEKYDGNVTYESLQDMKYMEQVINETMRMYPVVPVLVRICTEEYKVPTTNVILEKGTKLFIPNWGLQWDPDYFPNPDRFDPNRFSEENRPNIKLGTFLPFGEGPRICVGLRFAMIQMKMCLALLAKEFEFTVDSKMRVPLELDFGLIVKVKGGIWLNAKRIS